MDACNTRLLSIIKVTEASDDLLFVELISFELRSPDSLHGAVILQALLPSQLRLQWRTLFQLVQVAFLNVKHRMRGEVGEGAGDHNSGTVHQVPSTDWWWFRRLSLGLCQGGSHRRGQTDEF